MSWLAKRINNRCHLFMYSYRNESDMSLTDTSVRNKYLSVYGVLGLLQAGAIMTATIVISIGTLGMVHRDKKA